MLEISLWRSAALDWTHLDGVYLSRWQSDQHSWRKGLNLSAGFRSITAQKNLREKNMWLSEVTLLIMNTHTRKCITNISSYNRAIYSITSSTSSTFQKKAHLTGAMAVFSMLALFLPCRLYSMHTRHMHETPANVQYTTTKHTAQNIASHNAMHLTFTWCATNAWSPFVL